jgi:hypothetical protein
VASLPLKTGKAKATYRVMPDSLDSVEVYHFDTGSEAAMRKLVDRVLKTRSAAFVTYGSRGADFEAQVDALHDYHEELWNGPMNYLLRYVAQTRAAKLERVAFSAKNKPLELKLTDTLSDQASKVPLWCQVSPPHWQWRPKTCTQDGQERWMAELQGGEGARYIRFEAVPDGGNIVLTP